MGNTVRNYMDVYGIRKDFSKFKDEVYGANLSGTFNHGDTFFSFNKIIPEPKDTTEFTKEGLTYWYDWHFKHWGSDGIAIEVKLLDEGDHLCYKFDTNNNAPLKIYFKIIGMYTTLSFSIYAWEPQNDWGYILEGKYGKLTKFSYEYVDLVSSGNNETKALVYEEDQLNNTRQLVREVFPDVVADYPALKDYFCSEDSFAVTDDSDYVDDDDFLKELDISLPTI